MTDWQGKKLRTIELADSYRRLGEEFKSKQYRVSDCGTFLEFKRFINDNSMKLNKANFCKVRLCPMCSWRRSLKIYGQVSKIMDEVVKNEDLEFIFLTLTTRNCEGQDLSNTIDNIFNAFNKMTKRVK
ncbi:MAG TPA: protein rep, partial [Tissierellaceae bacterium]